ncbi:MAG TPA: tRNA pseudouridine(38-40) synthase TruA [Acidimicrobiales bacterium]|nr:tRNA pseudouridine(38-40) synthase TruA [Acidimicrobiales bacterium]
MTLFDLPEAPVGAATGEDEDRPPGPAGLGAHSEHDETAQSRQLRLRLVVAYDGAGFRGFAAQPGQRTVAGELGRALETALRQPVELTCAGRTDAGVHAAGQVVHTDVRGPVDTVSLVKAVNAMIGPAVVLRSAEPAPPGFDARRSARARRYRYLVLQAAVPDSLLAPLAWHVRDPLDIRAMAAAADALLGEHDFRAFCRRPPGGAPGEPIVRRVLDTAWHEVPWTPGGLDDGARLLRFDITAQSFCHQMVRSIVGTLAEVGRGRRRASDVTWMLASGDRSEGANLAPPHGLCLLSVEYRGPAPGTDAGTDAGTDRSPPGVTGGGPDGDPPGN